MSICCALCAAASSAALPCRTVTWLPGCSLYWPSTTTCSLAGKSAIDQRLSVADLRDGDGAVLDRIVGLDHIGVNALLALLHHRGRDGQPVVPRFQQQSCIHQFTWPQPVRGVGKFGLDLDRAGGLQDFVVDEIDFALVELDLVVLAVGENRQRLCGWPSAAGSAAGRFREA